MILPEVSPPHGLQGKWWTFQRQSPRPSLVATGEFLVPPSCNSVAPLPDGSTFQATSPRDRKEAPQQCEAKHHRDNNGGIITRGIGILAPKIRVKWKWCHGSYMYCRVLTGHQNIFNKLSKNRTELISDSNILPVPSKDEETGPYRAIRPFVLVQAWTDTHSKCKLLYMGFLPSLSQWRLAPTLNRRNRSVQLPIPLVS